MKMNKRDRISTPLMIVGMLTLPLAAIAADSSAQTNASSQTAQNDNVVMYLGKIEVHGQKDIIKTLQAIKVGLRQPYSSDPKLANVMVCRLQDEAGSHLNQWLICGTNKNLAKKRAYLQTAMTNVASATDPGRLTCASNLCYNEVFSVLNEELNSQPGQTLHAEVNGPGLRTLLEKIPYPTPKATPSPAPAARTHRQP